MTGSFTAPAGALASAVKYAARRLDPRPAIPAHAGLLFESDSTHLNVFGFSENATAGGVVPVTSGDAKVSFVVAGRLIASLVDTFPDKPVTFEHDGDTVTVTAGRFRATLPAMPDKDYPSLPGQARAAGMVGGAELADAIRRVGNSAARDTSTKPGLCGIHIDLGTDPGDALTFTATDSYQAARQSVDWTVDVHRGATGDAALVLASVLVDAVDAFGGSEPVTIGWDGSVFSLSTQTRSLVTRTMPVAEFPAAGIRPIFEAKTSDAVTVRVKDLTLPLKRAGLLRGKDNDSVTIRLSTGLATLVTQTEFNGGDEEIDVEYDGPETVMSMRTAMLHNAMTSSPGDTATMHFIPDTTKPVIVTSDADPTWRHMLVPLRRTGDL